MGLREKVVKGLECCLPMTTRDGWIDCKNCPYDRKITIDSGIIECCHELVVDAFELVKGGSREIIKELRYDEHGRCPECGKIVSKDANYCWYCGQAVKWNEHSC